MKDQTSQAEIISEDAFLQSKLFNQALSKPTSHYIQSKLMSLPSKEAQDLKKLDLRHMCDTVVRELQVVEKQAAYDYIKVSEELQQLGNELTVADGIMGELENVLLDFKGHLESIKNEMTSLQEKSNQMNTSLSNRKKLQNMLNSFIDSAVLDKELIDAICLEQINDNYVNHIKTLLKKLGYLNSTTIGTDSKAIKQLQPQLQKLKGRASVRLREFLLDKIATLKKPKANVNIIQKNVLLKFKIFTQFFKDHYSGIFTEICNVYRETMAKIYLNNYKTYLQQIYKLQTELYIKTDQILPLQPQHIRSFLQQTKPTTLNQGTKTIFSLMGREKTVDQSEQSDVILYNATTVKNQRFTMEQVFKSVNKVLMDGVLNEIVFTAQFFNMKSDGACELFGPIFRPALNLFIDHIKNTIAYTHDIYGVLLILAINEKNRNCFREREFKALNYYFDQISMIIWPKFQEIFQFHYKSLATMTTRQYRLLEKATSPKIIVSRFADFMISLYRLFDYFQDSKMVAIRIENLRKAFFDIHKKLRSEAERESDGLNEYLSCLEEFHSTMTAETGIKSKEFQDELVRLQKEIGMVSDKIVTGYIRDFFPNLDSFIQKYCKQEQSINEEAIFQISKNIDNKVIESLINDLSGHPLVASLQKLVHFCEKKYSGYSLKSLLKKFLSVFMKFYTEIYKHIKNNHPESASMMLQPHNAMKEIKTAFGKHIS